jgi:hypothetical protein
MLAAETPTVTLLLPPESARFPVIAWLAMLKVEENPKLLPALEMLKDVEMPEPLGMESC